MTRRKKENETIDILNHNILAITKNSEKLKIFPELTKYNYQTNRQEKNSKSTLRDDKK